MIKQYLVDTHDKHALDDLLASFNFVIVESTRIAIYSLCCNFFEHQENIPHFLCFFLSFLLVLFPLDTVLVLTLSGEVK